MICGAFTLTYTLPGHEIAQRFPKNGNADSRSVTNSHEKGYSSQPITQGQALALRKVREPQVECADGVQVDYTPVKWGLSFFPNSGGRGGQRRR